MKLSWVVLSGILAVLPASGHLEAQTSSLNVYVTVANVEERREIDRATKKELDAKADEARDRRKSLEKRLKGQYGKDRETWPREKDEELYDAEEAEAATAVAYAYRKVDLKGLKDSARDIVESIDGKGATGRKEGITLVQSATDAHLVVEVAGRRAEKTSPAQFVADRCFVLFNIGAGGKVDAARFAKVPADYRFKRFGRSAWKTHRPSPDNPVFTYESFNNGSAVGCLGTAANVAAVVVEHFARDNHALLADGTP